MGSLPTVEVSWPHDQHQRASTRGGRPRSTRKLVRGFGHRQAEPDRERDSGGAPTGYVILLHLPEGYKPEQVRDAPAAKITTLPESLRLSLTWEPRPRDARLEARLHPRRHRHLPLRPHSPWQRGTNENRNGQLRQYLPKGTDRHCTAALNWVAQAEGPIHTVVETQNR